MRNLSENAQAIDVGIKSLQYDPRTVMAFQGETISNFVPKKGSGDSDRFIVTTQIKHSVNGNFDIAVPTARKDITYPGALLLGNQKLIEGFPDPLVVHHRPMNITIDLPGLTNDNKYFVSNVDFSGVNGGINVLINNWLETKSNTFKISANMQYKKSILYDKKSMALTFGCNVEYLQNKLGINFNAIRNQESSAYLIQFRQIYYTVSAELPQAPSDVFADDVTWQDIQHKISNDNPPCYVQNVQYGREVYLLMQSDLSSEDLKTHLDGVLHFSNGSLTTDNDVETKKINKNINCSIITMGGKPIFIDGNLEDANIIEKVNNIISENVDFSAENPAFPLSYTVAFLKDNKIASIQGNTEYITSVSTEFRSGKLNLYHGGAYVARFYINWDLISYDEKGNEVLQRHEWENNGNQVTAGYSTVIPLPANAKNIQVKAEGATGLIWEPWRTSVHETFPLIASRSIEIYGTTLNQWAKIYPEK